MKYAFCFVSGAVLGALGTFVWLQKDYKKRVADLNSGVKTAEKSAENEENQGENGAQEDKNKDKKDEKSSENSDEDERREGQTRVLMGLTDRYGYTNYSDSMAPERRLESEKPENLNDFEENFNDKSDENEPESDENNENYVSVFEKSDTKSDTKVTHKEEKVTPNRDIYEISREDYLWLGPEWEKKELKFYTENEVFCDENDFMCHFFPLGVTFVSLFKTKVTHKNGENLPDFLWICDPKTGSAYEISVNYGSYVDD